MRRVVGFSPFIGSISAMIVWAVHFLVIYGVQATICVRLGTGRTLFGQPLILASVLGLTALSLVIVAVIGLRAWRRLESGMAGQEGEDQAQFTVWMTFSIALLSGLAILWEAVPVLILHPCG
ncbi:MAG TPA: hypothetical protein VGN83_23145 [Falsiroseomonas sp.]|jgi:hypothetical protein|nr:hypothetical protein [Falsiroseomonas sp.]